MKGKSGLFAAAMLLASMLGTMSAGATSTPNATYKKAVEVTGCLQQGPVAREYLLKGDDGKTWGINERDMMINNYVGKTVTIAGDQVRPNADERSSGGAQQYLRARDVAVDGENCSR